MVETVHIIRAKRVVATTLTHTAAVVVAAAVVTLRLGFRALLNRLRRPQRRHSEPR